MKLCAAAAPAVYHEGIIITALVGLPALLITTLSPIASHYVTVKNMPPGNEGKLSPSATA